jgi:hypothetical protein
VRKAFEGTDLSFTKSKQDIVVFFMSLSTTSNICPRVLKRIHTKILYAIITPPPPVLAICPFKLSFF